MLKTLMKTTLAAAMVAGSAMAASAQDYTLRATANSNENDEDYDGLVVFKDYVEKASNGAIAVELYIGTQLCGNGAECLQGIADGSIDIYISTSGGAAGIFPYVQVLDLPYLMADDRVAETVLRSDFIDFLRERMLDDSGGTIRLMTIGNTGGWRNFANTQHTARTPQDLEGNEDPHRRGRPAPAGGKGHGRLTDAHPLAGALHELSDRRRRGLQERHH